MGTEYDCKPTRPAEPSIVLDGIRTPRSWNDISGDLHGFADAETKMEKARWFSAQGVHDSSFLDGSSLPDGAGWLARRWTGRKLPPFSANKSVQPGVAPNLLDFFNRFFTAWLTGAPDATSLDAFVRSPRKNPDIAAALWLWRLRDHGTAIDILSAKGKPLKLVPAKLRSRYVERFPEVSKGVLPSMLEGDAPSTLLPFVIYSLKAGDHGQRRAIGLVRLLDAPYETVGVVAAEKVPTAGALQD